MVVLSLLTACTSPTAEPPTISDPMISDPTPQEPGKEVGISIDVSSAGGATLKYTWNADGGEIVRGQGSPAITYRVPEDPGTYNVRVRVEWDGQSTEKITSIQVVDDETAKQPPTATSLSLTNTPNPTDTPLPPTSTPSKQFVDRLNIPSTEESGITYKAIKSGIYIFQYVDSAYSAYPGSSWSTIVVGFSGPVPQWINDHDLDYDSALFSIGSGNHSSEQAAIQDTSGDRAVVRLSEEETITLVCGDGKPDYYDNKGDVILDVFLAP